MTIFNNNLYLWNFYLKAVEGAYNSLEKVLSLNRLTIKRITQVRQISNMIPIIL